MLDVVIALVPATIFGVYNFGIRALAVILVCVAVSLLTEYIYEKLMKKPVTIGDMSALITGLLIALNVPSSIPLWIPAIGCIFAILIVKQLYGGIGQNFMNPALAARCFLLISFAGRMSTFGVPVANSTKDMIMNGAVSIDGVSGATPLAAIKAGESVDILNMFFGNTSGTIGETSVIAILIGAIYMLAKKIISWRIPVAYIGTLVIFMLLFSGKGFDANFILGQVFGGGLMLGAFFMATDYASSPITASGKIIFGIAIGIFTGIFRLLGGSAEGVSYAIILGNLLSPIIEKATLPKSFGKGAEVHE
jgi:electron transport complex protein RnfD